MSAAPDRQRALHRVVISATALLAGGLTACAPSDVAQAPVAEGPQVRIGQQTFVVPPEFMEPLAAARIMGDDTLTALEQFPPLFIPIDADREDASDTGTFGFTAFPLDSQDIPAIPGAAMDAWHGAAAYTARIVRPDRPARLVRVYRQDEFPFSWHYFRSPPPEGDPQTLWRARCQVPDGDAEVIGLANVNCETYLTHGELGVLISFPGARIGCRDLIVARAREMLAQWAQPVPTS